MGLSHSMRLILLAYFPAESLLTIALDLTRTTVKPDCLTHLAPSDLRLNVARHSYPNMEDPPPNHQAG